MTFIGYAFPKQTKLRTMKYQVHFSNIKSISQIPSPFYKNQVHFTNTKAILQNNIKPFLFTSILESEISLQGNCQTDDGIDIRLRAKQCTKHNTKSNMLIRS
jgi:hypothetical protein